MSERHPPDGDGRPGGGGPVRRLLNLGLRRPPAAEEVAWEVEHYLVERTDRLVREGWEPEAARIEAERLFGLEKGYDRKLRFQTRWEGMMRRLDAPLEVVGGGMRDFVRGIRQAPLFALAVVTVLGLGVGANASMFGIVDRLLLQPPPHLQAPQDLYMVGMTRGRRPGFVQSSMTFPDYLDLKSHEGMRVAGESSKITVTLGSGAAARSVAARQVSHDYFELLGVRPMLGREFTEEEDRVGVPGTAVFSYEFWRSEWGSDPGAIGKTIMVSGEPYSVIGVAPPQFSGVSLQPVDLWLPIETYEAQSNGGNVSFRTNRRWWWLHIVSRLNPGVAPEAAIAEADAIFRAAGGDEDIQARRVDQELDLTLTQLRDRPKGAEASVAKWLLGVAMAVLIIACANVANLLLARAVRRERETSVRLALGASRLRVSVQQGVEAVLLALLGGLVAIAIGKWATPVISSLLLPDVIMPSVFNRRILGFTALASIMAGGLAALGPALQAGRWTLAGLQRGSRNATRSSSRARALLTATQAGLSVVLLVGAGLFVMSLRQVDRLDLGIDVDGVYLVQLELTRSGSAIDRQEQTRIYLDASERAARLPGVVSSGVTQSPFGWAFGYSLTVPGVDSIPRMPGGGPYYYAIDSDYLGTLGIEILAGRGIEESDREGSESVAVVTKSMADSIWGGAALGQCMMIGRASTCTTVVGIVEDATRGGLRDEPYFAYYVPISQGRYRAEGIYVRTASDRDDVASAIATALRTFDPEVRFARVQSLREMLDPEARSWKLGASMFTLFGMLALVVSAVGLYSLLAFSVAEQTRELGIRRALGADARSVLHGVVFRGMRLVVLGVALGLLVAWYAAPYAADLLFDVSPREPRVFGIVGLVLVFVSVLASLGPAIRATRVDPLVALQAE